MKKEISKSLTSRLNISLFSRHTIGSFSFIHSFITIKRTTNEPTILQEQYQLFQFLFISLLIFLRFMEYLNPPHTVRRSVYSKYIKENVVAVVGATNAKVNFSFILHFIH